TYMLFLYPYLEQDNVFRKFDQNPLKGTPDGYSGVIVWCGTSNALPPDPLTAVVVRGLKCPSDGGGDTSTHYAQGSAVAIWNHVNYLGFFGDKNYGGFFPGNTPNKPAVFGYNRGARITDITDGTSKTMIFGEYLRGLPQEFPEDHRGAHWVDWPCYSQVYTQ